MIRPKVWFRVYTEILDDYDVNMLSDADFRMLIKLWCIARMGDGLLPSVERIAFRLRLPEAKVQPSVSRLVNAGYLDEKEGVLVPHNWHERQFESDCSTERVKRFRKRFMKRDETVSCNGVDVFHETATYTDTDTETPIVPLQGTKKKGSLRDKQRGWFDEFWAAYPRKTAKVAAERKFRTQCKDEAQFSRIMSALKSQTPALLAKEPEFRPHPATWLNQGRWMDEPDAPLLQSEDDYDGYRKA